MPLNNPRSKAALFNVGSTLTNLINKYAISSPFTPHDRMIINLYFAQMFERIFAMRANIANDLYDFSPLTIEDLKIVNDMSFDQDFTKTVQWQMLHQCIDNIGPVVTTRISANTLIIEF